jgi:endogenous inhibitor of DNA gyrase (YacG/DUF329 family)
MDISISLPLDSDGFLRRECPHCEQQFKWHHGPANAEAEAHPDPATYHCPLCGDPAEPGSWWTQEQSDYTEGTAMPTVVRGLQDELPDAFHGNKHIQFKPDHGDVPDVPSALTEPDDMRIVASPCHAYEPVKVPHDFSGAIYRLICGDAFAV